MLNDRVVGPKGANQRVGSSTQSASVHVLESGFKFTAKGYVIGEKVSGNPIWFVGKNSNQFIWSGATTDPSTRGLNQIVQKDTNIKPALVAELKCVTRVVPAHVDNFGKGGFPEKPTTAVIHQFGTKGKDTLSSLIIWFQMGKNARNNGGRVSSSHFAVSGDEIIQLVSLKDRAYHAGTGGNHFVGIETDPYQDSKTVKSVNRLLKELNEYYGYTLKLTKHKDVVGSNTNCGTDINMKSYTKVAVVKPATPKPSVPKVPDYKNEAIELLNEAILKIKKL